MDYLPHRHQKQVLISNTLAVGSKAQLCLHKILHIISSFQPLDSDPSVNRRHRIFGFDLNLTSNPPAEETNKSEPPASFSPICSDSGECEPKYNTKREIEENVTEISVPEVTNPHECDVEEVKTMSFKSEGRGGQEDYLWLLVEAAKLVSGEFDADAAESEVTKTASHGKKMGSAPAVMRSRRGRRQVLPYRYRDSVVAPWNRLAAAGCRKRRRRVL